MIENRDIRDADNPVAVAAVIVTFNRCNYLVECIDAVLSQSHPVSRLIIVDNASTDGTEPRIRELGYDSHPLVEYHRLPENTGGSGGFNFGLEKASQYAAADWFWVMDDDVAPSSDCLANLLLFRGMSECIHPLVVYDDGTEHEWEHLIDPGSTYQIGLGNRSFKHGKDWCTMNTACFEGMLVSRRIVTVVGLPRKEFFVYGDDNLYGYMASMHTNVLYVKKAILNKKIKPNKDHSPFKIYYDIRNRFLLRRLMYPYFKHNSYSRMSFALFIALHTANFVVHPFRFKKLKAAYHAWMDGVRGVTGRMRY